MERCQVRPPTGLPFEAGYRASRDMRIRVYEVYVNTKVHRILDFLDFKLRQHGRPRCTAVTGQQPVLRAPTSVH